MPEPGDSHPLRTGLIARDGLSMRRSFLFPRSSCFFLFDLFNRSLQFAHIVERDFPGLGQLSHHWLCASAEETENLVEEPEARRFTSCDWFKNVGVADLPAPSHGALSFQSIDGCLDGGVGRLGFGEGFLDFANRCVSAAPKDLQ